MPRPCCKRSRCGATFQCINGEMENGYGGLLHNSVFDTSNICSAVFTLAINRLHSFKRQLFWFHSLNSMVPVKGIDLFY